MIIKISFKDSGFPDLLLSIKKESDTLNYYELIGRYLSLFHKCKSLNIPKSKYSKILKIFN